MKGGMKSQLSWLCPDWCATSLPPKQAALRPAQRHRRPHHPPSLPAIDTETLYFVFQALLYLEGRVTITLGMGARGNSHEHDEKKHLHPSPHPIRR
ncbi:hypothetical protein EJ06DRAFT_534241 [Trichodelitschia bisporula]|uniref:Uncharacterized protein n=1 Tax=Trichodelitschia bisporula TaxID=703511 RepID=A0A6G1HJS0_9PEZI|nr:hypothetical protein EJ06DRAFT_534241 [Trichodelitschia bisporula]